MLYLYIVFILLSVSHATFKTFFGHFNIYIYYIYIAKLPAFLVFLNIEKKNCFKGEKKMFLKLTTQTLNHASQLVGGTNLAFVSFSLCHW